MKQKSGPGKAPAEQVLKDIRRQTRRQYSAEEKIRIVLEGLRGEENISELCRREGIAASMYYGWSKEFLEAGKRRLAGDTARAATSGEVKDLRRETAALKEVVADLTLENRLLKKRMARPVCKGVCNLTLISLRQRIRPRSVASGHDGDTRAPVLIKRPALSRHLFDQASEAPFDCQAISSSPSRKHPRQPDTYTWAGPPSLLSRYGPSLREALSVSQHRPGDPGELVCESDNGDIVMGASYERFRPPSQRRVPLSYMGQRRARSMD